MATEVLHLDGEVLAGAYRTLVNAKQGFDQARDVAEDVRTAIGQPDDMAAKVTGFADSWSVNRERLSKSVGKLAEKLKGIMDSFEDLDDKFGHAFADATDTTSSGASGSVGSGGATAGSAASSGTSAGASSLTGRPSGSAPSGVAGGPVSVSGAGGGADPTASTSAAGGVNTTPAQTTLDVPGTTPSAADTTAGSTDPVSSASPGSASGGVVAMGGAALSAGSAAAVGSLYRAWNGQVRRTTPAPVPAQSRATIAQEFRGMSGPGGSATTSAMSRGEVASLMRKDGSGLGPMGLRQAGSQAGKSDRERRSRISPPPSSDADSRDDSATERGAAYPQDELDRDPRSQKREAK